MKRLSWFGLFNFLQLRVDTTVGLDNVDTLQEVIVSLAARIKALEEAE